MACLLHRRVQCLPLFAVLAALGCDPGPEADLADRTFLSESVTEGGAPKVLVDGTRLQLQFLDSSVTGDAGCNEMAGPYEIADDLFVMTDNGQTLVACDEERHDQEEWYFTFLLSKPSIEIDGDSLVLDGSGTRIEYLDQDVATPDAALVGPTWTVETIIADNAATTMEWPVPATLVFGDDGTVMVSTGCNSGSGTYSGSGRELVFADVAVSERGCEGDTGVLESAVLEVVTGPQPVTYGITDDRLSLRGQGVRLELVAKGG